MLDFTTEIWVECGSEPAWERARAARERMAEDSDQAQRLRDVRDKLCSLLEESVLYDARAVLQRCADTELWDEQVVLHSKVRLNLLRAQALGSGSGFGPNLTIRACLQKLMHASSVPYPS